MVKFQYGKAIIDSFRLVFNNLYIFVPILLLSVFGLLLSPMYFKLITPSGGFNVEFIMANPSIVILIVVLYIILFILSYIAYGWTFALIGQIVKKGKADLFKEFKNAPKKGLCLFLLSLILLLIFMGLFIALMILIIIAGLISNFLKILGVILIILLLIAWFVGIIALMLLYIHVVPLIALENFGAIKTIKLSFEHFKNNKGHSLALFCIIVLFFVVTSFIMYVVLFLFIGSFNSEALVNYMFNNPIKYSIVSFFAVLPNLVIYMWSFAFLTIAYVRKKRLGK